MRLEKVLAHVVDDQNGFVKNRLGFHNVRRVLNLCVNVCEGSPDTAILSFDTEKAFDCVKWPYLLDAGCLKVLGLVTFVDGLKFCLLIRLLKFPQITRFHNQ